MVVCIAEKPSVARDIAHVLGATQKRDGYMEGNGYQVTWTFGHLCTLKEPHDYRAEWREWRLEMLPMLPPRFGIKLIDTAGYKTQFAVIARLMQSADEIVNCGDAGQEGELIQRWVMQKAGAHCPVKRLWISSLTEEAIRDGFAHLRPAADFQRLYEAGLSRAIGDWILGMNATRMYTLRYARERGQVLSVGRVQTPTLAMIVNRQREIEHFEPRPYWILTTTYRDTTFTAIVRKTDEEPTDGKPTDDDRLAIDPIRDRDEGEAIAQRIADEPFTIVNVAKKQGRELPPRLFDLTSLQVECNKRYAYSADDTLRLIQSLYEKKLTTYPRVDTTYLSDDIYPRCAGILKGLRGYEELTAPLEGKPLPKSKKVFDNTKVTDHHAIIPTGQPAGGLTDMERRVYDLVTRRFIAAFYPDCRVATTTVTGQAGDVGFRVNGKQIVDPGWRRVFANAAAETPTDDGPSADNGTEARTLPAFTRGESGPHVPQLNERWTTPPKPYTEATLLRAMETAGRQVDDEELRDALKENGIGRPSTRAAIIETLFKRGYIRRERKTLVATPVGCTLIDTIGNELLKSAELTGQWERKLRQIEHGDYAAGHFLDELKQMAADLVIVGSPCPHCGSGRIVRGHTQYGCSRWREGCTYRRPFVSASNE